MNRCDVQNFGEPSTSCLQTHCLSYEFAQCRIIQNQYQVKCSVDVELQQVTIRRTFMKQKKQKKNPQNKWWSCRHWDRGGEGICDSILCYIFLLRSYGSQSICHFYNLLSFTTSIYFEQISFPSSFCLKYKIVSSVGPNTSILLEIVTKNGFSLE